MIEFSEYGQKPDSLVLSIFPIKSVYYGEVIKVENQPEKYESFV
jgi:hypothetical protein